MIEIATRAIQLVERRCVLCRINPAVKNMVACNECLSYAFDRAGVPAESPDDLVTQDRVPMRLWAEDEDGYVLARTERPWPECREVTQDGNGAWRIEVPHG